MEINETIQEMKDHSKKGDVREILTETTNRFEKKKAFPLYARVLTYAASVVLTAAVAIPLTWYITSLNKPTGHATNDDVISYVSRIATHAYLQPVKSFIGNGTLLGEWYYSFNDDKTAYLTMHLNLDEVSKFSYFDTLDHVSTSSTEDLSYSAFSGTTVTITKIEFLTNDGIVTFSDVAIDLTPYMNYALAH